MPVSKEPVDLSEVRAARARQASGRLGSWRPAHLKAVTNFIAYAIGTFAVMFVIGVAWLAFS